MNSFLKYQKLTLGWALFVLILCNTDIGPLGRSPRFFPGFDKLVHCGLFYMFTLLYANGFIKQGNNFTWLTAVKVLIIGISYGALIEVLQLYIFTWRTGDWADLFADSVGAGMAAFSVLMTTLAVKQTKR